MTTAQLHSTKPTFWFCADSNPVCGVSEIYNGENLLQWSRLKIRLNVFCQSTMPQKQFITTTTTIMIITIIIIIIIIIGMMAFNTKIIFPANKQFARASTLNVTLLRENLRIECHKKNFNFIKSDLMSYAWYSSARKKKKRQNR